MTTSRARAAKPKPAADMPADDGDGLLRIGENPEEPKYEPLFRLGGKAYAVLVNPSGSLKADYLHRLRSQGANLALSQLMEEMLSPDAYTAIRENRKVSDDDLRQVMRVCAQIVTGTAAPKSPTGANRSATR